MKVLELLAIEAGDTGFVGRPGKEIAPLIHHRDLSRRQFGNRRRHEMNDTGDLPRIEHSSGTKLHEDRGTGLLGLPHEHGGAGDREVYSRLLDLGHRLDRAGKVSLEGPLVVHLLHELTHAEFLGLHQLEAHATAFRKALRRQLQTDLVDHFGWHEDRAAALRDAVRHVHLG
jgi:hypothetical protein